MQVIVVMSVELPESFFPETSILFAPTFKATLVVTTPSALKEKLFVLFPFIVTVTSCQDVTFAVCTLILYMSFSTVTGVAGLINLTTGGSGRTGLLQIIVTLSLELPASFAQIISSLLVPSARVNVDLTMPEPGLYSNPILFLLRTT